MVLEAATGGVCLVETGMLEEAEEDLPPSQVELGPFTAWVPKEQDFQPVSSESWASGPVAGGGDTAQAGHKSEGQEEVAHHPSSADTPSQ